MMNTARIVRKISKACTTELLRRTKNGVREVLRGMKKRRASK